MPIIGDYDDGGDHDDDDVSLSINVNVLNHVSLWSEIMHNKYPGRVSMVRALPCQVMLACEFMSAREVTGEQIIIANKGVLAEFGCYPVNCC